MDLEFLKAKREEARQDEDFWWLRHRECAAAEADQRDDLGWLWLNARHRRQRLDLMIQKVQDQRRSRA